MFVQLCDQRMLEQRDVNDKIMIIIYQMYTHPFLCSSHNLLAFAQMDNSGCCVQKIGINFIQYNTGIYTKISKA